MGQHSSFVHQVKLEELEAELIEMNANGDKLQCSYNELVEYKLVLQKVQFLGFSMPEEYIELHSPI